MCVSKELKERLNIVTEAAGWLSSSPVGHLIQTGVKLIAEDKNEAGFNLEQPYTGKVFKLQGEITDKGTVTRP